MAPITVHHLDMSRSHRIVWLLELLQLPYEIKDYKRNSQTGLAPPELKKVHPLGKAPVVQDGDLTIAESGAIIMHLCERENKLMPSIGTPERLQFHYWMHYAEGTLMPPLVMTLVFSAVPNQAPWFLRPILKPVCDKVVSSYIGPQLDTNLEMIEAHLGANKWFAGNEITGADVNMSFPLEALFLRRGQNDSSRWPNIASYMDRIKNLDSYKAAEARGGKLNIMSGL
ncbi:Glutathione S-transferase 3 [Hondaea fermentalgiana]|uniref:glutathione transferase n=1 Tax=Hondaea fermentalgiana TaxID=2315210 RepID=A0A2R5GRR7_9STRA|nr:Glutathione S-transferase 3 [Hondaea fermentalgiana]|eukprot:GBG30574.1 Glutathione S-transferase 3 [Hondaea fermentalgiana]